MQSDTLLFMVSIFVYDKFYKIQIKIFLKLIIFYKTLMLYIIYDPIKKTNFIFICYIFLPFL